MAVNVSFSVLNSMATLSESGACHTVRKVSGGLLAQSAERAHTGQSFYVSLIGVHFTLTQVRKYSRVNDIRLRAQCIRCLTKSPKISCCSPGQDKYFSDHVERMALYLNMI